MNKQAISYILTHKIQFNNTILMDSWVNEKPQGVMNSVEVNDTLPEWFSNLSVAGKEITGSI